jgi:hypothetical protein
MLRAVLLFTVLATAASSSFGAVCSDVMNHHGIRALRVSAGIKDEDTTSASFVFELREAIRKSASYCLVETDGDARFAIGVNAMDIESGSLTAISTSIFAPNLGRFHVSAWVSVCGRAVVPSCAHDVLARVDNELEKLRD